MARRARERLPRQGIVLPETPVDRRRRAELAEDLDGSPVTGKRLRQRLRNFKVDADRYLASLGGPLPYMARLRDIHRQVAMHEAELEAAWKELATVCAGDPDGFASRWRAFVGERRFERVNALIESHNRWYPIEARLPMDPATHDYVLVGGERYERRPLDAAWALELFPADLSRASVPAQSTAHST